MSLRGRINISVENWRFERAMRHCQRKLDQAAKDPRWVRTSSVFDFAWNIVQFCLLAVVAIAILFIAISFFYRYYPSTTCVVLELFGICK